MTRQRRAQAGVLLTLSLCLLAGCAGIDSGPQPIRHGALVLDGVPPVPESVLESLGRYQNTRSAGFRGWLGGGMLIATRFGDTTQLHRVREPGGARQQITFFEEPVSRAWTSPANHEGFIYARDVGGSEFYQLFWYDTSSGESRLLTDGQSRNSGVVWNNAGDRFAFSTNRRNGTNWDIHIQDLAGAETPALVTEAGSWAAEDFAPGDERMLVTRYVSINESHAYQLDLASGQLTALLPVDIKSGIGRMLYDHDGSGVYFTSDLGAEFRRLHHLDLASGAMQVLTADTPWDVEDFALSDDGNYLAFSVNERGRSRLVVHGLATGAPLALPELPQGVLSGLGFSPDSRSIAVSLNTASAPADVFSLSLQDRTVSRWTRSEMGGLAGKPLSEPELIEFETFDTVNRTPRRIPAFVYRPAGAGPHPVLISIHGGPEGQYRPRFSPTFQYLVGELGIAVIAPNVRGSSGYGKSYLKLDNGLLREDSVRDIGALIDWVNGQPDLDPARVVVMGGSYGGYMVLASLTHYSDRLAAGIESVGISNFVTFLTNTQSYRRDLRRAEYGDERDPEMRAHLEAISPLNQVHKITRPLMISQGANDPRVPASESAQIVAALKESAVPVWYVLAENEGHGFRKKANRDYNLGVITLFLREHLHL